MALNHTDKIDLKYVIMAPARNVEEYIKGAKDTKRHFDVNKNSKYSVILGAFSEYFDQHLTLKNVSKEE